MHGCSAAAEAAAAAVFKAAHVCSQPCAAPASAAAVRALAAACESGAASADSGLPAGSTGDSSSNSGGGRTSGGPGARKILLVVTPHRVALLSRATPAVIRTFFARSVVFSGVADAAGTRLALVTRDGRTGAHELHLFAFGKGLAGRVEEALQRAFAAARVDTDRAASCVRRPASPLVVVVAAAGPLPHSRTPSHASPFFFLFLFDPSRYERFVQETMRHGNESLTGRVLGTFPVFFLDSVALPGEVRRLWVFFTTHNFCTATRADLIFAYCFAVGVAGP